VPSQRQNLSQQGLTTKKFSPDKVRERQKTPLPAWGAAYIVKRRCYHA
jgi:hypothetical protein